MKRLSEINGKKYPWWNDCIREVESELQQDRTTTNDNLREKAKNCAKGYFAANQITGIDKEGIVEKIADEIEQSLKDLDHVFDNRPLAGIVAKKTRESVPESPENRFVRLK